MRLIRVPLAFAVFAAVLSACGGGGSDDPTTNIHAGVSLPPMSGSNVLPITVNGSLCSSGSYTNKPCVSVTVCTPGTSSCVTVSDILLDTGSYGLRVFKSALNGLSLPQVTDGLGGSIAECVQFGDGSSDWGPVQMADVVLGGEPAAQVPIQVIDSTFYAGKYSCAQPDSGPAMAGFNGILGVGLFIQDCGPTCASSAGNGFYYACSGSTCSGSKVALSDQVQSPVAALPDDNNGVIVSLPSVGTGGVEYANGYLILGIDTASNNLTTGVTTYIADWSGEFSTTFNGNTYSSFLDTGSNGLFFPGNLSPCGSQASGFFCPGSTVSYTATNTAALGGVHGAVSFQIGNMIDLLNTGNSVFVESGGSSGGGLSGLFDWGLPFFYGRNVYIGLEGTSTNPYWAY